MAESYEYPPRLIQHRPLQYNRQGLYPATLKLRHHFFLTRVKIIFREVLTGSMTDEVEEYLQQELVRTSYSNSQSLILELLPGEFGAKSRLVCGCRCSGADPTLVAGIVAGKVR
jgi:hypothetical protein